MWRLALDVSAWAFVRGTIARCSDLTQRRAKHGSVVRLPNSGIKCKFGFIKYEWLNVP